MKSIYWRNFSLTAGIVLLSILLDAVLFSWLSFNYTVNENRKTLRATAYVLADTTSAKSTEVSLDDWDIRMLILSVSKSSDVHVSLAGTDGTVFACSDSDLFCRHIGCVLPEGVLEKVSEEGLYEAKGTLGTYYDGSMYYAGVQIPSPDGGDAIGYVFVAVSTDSMTLLWRPVVSLFVLVGCVVLLVALITSLIVTRRQMSPLHEMAQAAGKLAKGQFDVRVKGGQIEEIEELADAFNMMAGSMETAEMNRREFIANVSHELKTPMTTISGFADGLLDGTIPQEDSQKYIAVIAEETRRLSRLVRRMLDLSRMQSVDTSKLLNSSFDVTEVARRAVLALGPKIDDKKLDVVVELPEEEVVVRGEADTIMQVIYNILDNAVKFAFEGGTVKLRIWKQDQKANVAIGDTGETIPEDDLPMIFDRFHKSDRSRSLDRDGVGLGLYIVKAILTGYGEDIKVTSKDNWTEFVFTLTLK